jgi:hypothetical protein
MELVERELSYSLLTSLRKWPLLSVERLAESRVLSRQKVAVGDGVVEPRIGVVPLSLERDYTSCVGYPDPQNHQDHGSE